MKGFSEEIEKCMSYSFRLIISTPADRFAEFTVEPVPLIKDTPDKLMNIEFLAAESRHCEYHQKRIEREGRG